MASSSESLPERIEVVGVQAESAKKVEGLFEKTERLENFRHVWKLEKESGTFCIWNWKLPTNNKFLWMISREEHIGTQNAYAVVQSKATDPCEIKNGWLIYNAALNKHEQCPTFKMTAMPAPKQIEEDIDNLLDNLFTSNEDDIEEF